MYLLLLWTKPKLGIPVPSIVIPSCGLSQGLQGLIISSYGDHITGYSDKHRETQLQPNSTNQEQPPKKTPESSSSGFCAICSHMLVWVTPWLRVRFRNCCLPVMVCNAVMSAGMAHLAGLIEGGMSHRDAVAQVYKVTEGQGIHSEQPLGYQDQLGFR